MDVKLKISLRHSKYSIEKQMYRYCTRTVMKELEEESSKCVNL
jgi:hypothetical protein